MKRKKLKKKPIIIISIILVILFSCGVLTTYLIMKNRIKNNYGDTVVVTKDSDIYDSKKKSIGTIKKGVVINLAKRKSATEEYYKVQNGDFYVYYKNVEKTKGKEFKNKYLVFNNNIKRNKMEFYQKDKIVLTLNKELSLPIEYMDDKYYYVSYLGSLFGLKRDKNDKLENVENTKEQENSYISVFKYDGVSIDKIKEEIKHLTDNKYETLTLDEYKEYIKGNIRLKGNYVLLMTTNLTDEIKGINKESKLNIVLDDNSVKFKDNNEPSNRNSHNRYVITNNTSLELFTKMLEGKPYYEKTTNKVAVLNYHFFYNPDKGESCNEIICLKESKFREQLDYLRDNGFKTLTMDEFYKWMYGEIELPEKSVLLTIDDGAMGTGKQNGNILIPVLEEYDMHATLFLIAGWWDIENYRSKNLDIQSHTYDMHNYGTCGKGQLICASYDEAKADLQKSIDVIKDNTAFCYPFYNYSDTAIRAVKDVGFKLAFESGNVKATRNNDKYKVPRYSILSDTSLEEFKRKVN